MTGLARRALMEETLCDRLLLVLVLLLVHEMAAGHP